MSVDSVEAGETGVTEVGVLVEVIDGYAVMIAVGRQGSRVS